ELRHALGDADLDQRPVERDLARGGGEDVLAAQHMGDAHEGVIHGVDQGVERLAVRAHDDEVGRGAGLEGDLAAHHVGEGDVLLRHAQSPGGLAALGAEGGLLLLGEVAVVAVVAELRVAAGGAVALGDLLRGGEGLVDVPGLLQPGDHVLVDLAALGLAVGAVRAADLDALVPVDAGPAHGVEQLVVGLLAVAGGVGVLDAEDELAAVVAGVGPVEQGGAHHADVRGAGGAGAEADADLVGGRGSCGGGGHEGFSLEVRGRAQRRTRGLDRVPIPSISTSIRAPGSTVRTPAGVPVSTMSPGRRVTTEEISAISSGTPRTMPAVEPDWAVSSSTREEIASPATGSRSVSIQGPIGQEVSKALARNHWSSARWESRAVRSFAQVYPSTWSATCSGARSLAIRLTTTASSASRLTSWL